MAKFISLLQSILILAFFWCVTLACVPKNEGPCYSDADCCVYPGFGAGQPYCVNNICKAHRC